MPDSRERYEFRETVKVALHCPGLVHFEHCLLNEAFQDIIRFGQVIETPGGRALSLNDFEEHLMWRSGMGAPDGAPW